MYSLRTYYVLGTLLWASMQWKKRIDEKLRTDISAMKQEKGCLWGITGVLLLERWKRH